MKKERNNKSYLYLLFFLLSLFVFLSTITSISAQICDSEKTCQEKIKEYEQKLTEIRQQKNTLASQISYFDTQITLTTIKIQQTENNIVKLTNEIEQLSEKIEGLNESLNFLSKTLLQKINEVYKRRQIGFFDVLIDSKNAGILMSRLKYIKIAQNNDQRLIFKVQQTKINFEEQKRLREEKKVELDNLKIQLAQQKNDLNSQKAAKQRLLELTQNDEKTYQKFLEEARKQLNSFKSFVKSAGGGIIPANGFGSGSDGWYYSQRDERWAYKLIGASQEIILEVGCFITSIAMVMKKNGIDWTPATIASDPNYFFANTAYMLVPSRFSWPNGLRYSVINQSIIDEEIKNGYPVIVGVYAGKYGTHYVVLKQIEGDDYIMHDPYYGPDKKFSDYYSKNSIFVAGVFK